MVWSPKNRSQCSTTFPVRETDLAAVASAARRLLANACRRLALLAINWNDAGVTATYTSAFNQLYFRATNSGPFTFLASGTVDVTNQRVDFSNVSLADGYYTLVAPPVPEPSTLMLVALAGVGLVRRVHRRRQA